MTSYVKPYEDGIVIIEDKIHRSLRSMVEMLKDPYYFIRAHTVLNDMEMNASEWEYVDNGMKRNFVLRRDINHPLFKKKSLVFNEIHYMEINETNVHFTTVSYNPDMPYGASFEVTSCLTLIPCGDTTNIVIKGKINWLKSCIMKSLVTSISVKELKDIWLKVIAELNSMVLPSNSPKYRTPIIKEFEVVPEFIASP